MLALSTTSGGLGEGGPTCGRPVSGSRVQLRRRTNADALSQGWIPKFPPETEVFVKPLDGWIGARVGIGGAQLDFATRTDAETFARRHGWIVEPTDPLDTGTTH
jgi:hypothetical protein